MFTLGDLIAHWQELCDTDGLGPDELAAVVDRIRSSTGGYLDLMPRELLDVEVPPPADAVR